MTTISEWTKIADALRFLAVHSVAYTVTIDLKDAELLTAGAKALELAGKQLLAYETALLDISSYRVARSKSGAAILKGIAQRALNPEVAQLRNSAAKDIPAAVGSLPEADHG